MKEISKKGRRIKYTEEFAREIIKEYLDEYKTVKNINYNHIYEFTIDKRNEKKISEIPEISYWRKVGRTGREIVDEYNKILLEASKDTDLDIEHLNLLTLIEGKFISSQYYNIVKDYTEKKIDYIKKITRNHINLEDEIEKLKAEREELYKRNLETEKLLINVYHYILNNRQIENKNLFNNAYNKIFEDPTVFTEEFMLEQERNTKDNTIRSIFEFKLKK
ncbi:hypothetical protein SAMN05216187_1225 [Jeotgalicoccus aerolatus]|uniref:Uncharacterized protein n=1 Tax=Jeotgalicoccus aerolatus TaxID=709510 RepID=A0A1G9EV66_9STAP|nr:hypothetical protein [Jeotgalicoccus aerolatus]SDK80020.1 hypothetical protein SAMN05216187_1225 [Jeotgalicoccus aerolatus]